MTEFKDVYNFECKVFEPSTAELSIKELRQMLKKLYEYFPYTQKLDGNKEPHSPDSEYSKKWFQAYNHLLMLLESKKQEAKHNLALALSIIAIIVSAAGVLARLLAKSGGV